MDNAQLHLGFWQHRFTRLRQPFEPIDTGDKTVLDPLIVRGVTLGVAMLVKLPLAPQFPW